MKDSKEAKGTVTWPAANSVFPTDLNPGCPSGPHVLISQQPFGLRCSLWGWVVTLGAESPMRLPLLLVSSYQLPPTGPRGQVPKAALPSFGGFIYWKWQILRVEHSGWKGIPFQKSFHLHILTWDLWNVHVGLKRGVYNDLLCIRRAETSACFQTFTEAVPLGGSRKEPWHLEDRRQGCILPWKVLLQETSHGQQGGGKRCPCSHCHIGTAQRPSQHVYGVTRCVVLRIKEG